jgi:hypothetical protein
VLDGAVDWIERNRRIWAERFDQLDRHLRELWEPAPGTTEGRPTEGPITEGPTTEGKQS